MSNRADAIAPLLAVVAMVAGSYGYGALKTGILTERYLEALDLCATAPATGAGRIARLDRTHTQWWRDKLPEELRTEARECVLDASHRLAEDDGRGRGPAGAPMSR